MWVPKVIIDIICEYDYIFHYFKLGEINKNIKKIETYDKNKFIILDDSNIINIYDPNNYQNPILLGKVNIEYSKHNSLFIMPNLTIIHVKTHRTDYNQISTIIDIYLGPNTISRQTPNYRFENSMIIANIIQLSDTKYCFGGTIFIIIDIETKEIEFESALKYMVTKLILLKDNIILIEHIGFGFEIYYPTTKTIVNLEYFNSIKEYHRYELKYIDNDRILIVGYDFSIYSFSKNVIKFVDNHKYRAVYNIIDNILVYIDDEHYLISFDLDSMEEISRSLDKYNILNIAILPDKQIITTMNDNNNKLQLNIWNIYSILEPINTFSLNKCYMDIINNDILTTENGTLLIYYTENSNKVDIII